MSSDALEDWPRPYYQTTGGQPFLFYVVFGATVDGLTLSRSQYRCDGIPAGLELLSYGPDSHPEVLDSFRSGYLWDDIQRGDPELAKAIGAQQHCIVVRGELADAENLNYFRNTIGLVTCLLDNGGVGVLDPQSLAWWSAQAWRDRVFGPGKALPREHVVILVSEERDGTRWFHTRGMRKFGRPDLSLHHVPPQYHDAVTDLFNRLIELHAFGGVIAEGQEVRMRDLPSGMYCRHGGSEDDPDFNNVHVEVHWP
ncbi:hypothetical protein MA04_00969 [Alcanivorax balearicus MACL04]|uniref:DUF4261 domain-containing protein n=1 Tax=Alloalcanivorax balearicus MACL04 TaxID=1177182 RepID=A0ABT2QVW9_9GAMM|nr:hypothetical protein [Alloalcanivorax balearicus]MCU5781669.1 hypothetical protein [Alloalcanivorax balearicus MACL04]